jgi:hypothetical protein
MEFGDKIGVETQSFEVRSLSDFEPAFDAMVCPLLGAKRTLVGDVAMSAFDPKRTLALQFCCAAPPSFLRTMVRSDPRTG